MATSPPGFGRRIEAKSGIKGATRSNRKSPGLRFGNVPTVSNAASSELMKAGLAQAVLAGRGIHCPQGPCDLEIEVLPLDDPIATIDVTCHCVRHGWSQQTQLMLAEFIAASKRV